MHRTAFLMAALLVVSGSLFAQEPDHGFEKTSGAAATVAELIAHPDLFVMDVQFKPMRMLKTDVAGENELIWYLVYRVVNRDLGREVDESDTRPVNAADKKITPLFAPDFTLVTADAGEAKVYHDVINPQIQRAIERREGIKLKNPLQMMGPPPPVTAVDSPEEVKNARYGVAIWRNVDPKTDRVVLFMTGLSNGYRLSTDPTGKLLVERKTVVQKFWRPGDEFEQDEEEFRFEGEPRWIYRAQKKTLGLKPKVAVGTPAKPAAAADDAGDDAA